MGPLALGFIGTEFATNASIASNVNFKFRSGTQRK